ncbi:hypothetical protein [Rheinheimera gaetbuli]
MAQTYLITEELAQLIQGQEEVSLMGRIKLGKAGSMQTDFQCNITRQVGYPTLKACGLRERVLYQTRHTAAMLWLAAGENLEWISSQMDHTTTEMLVRVSSRFVANVIRQDNSAFDSSLKAHRTGGAK